MVKIILTAILFLIVASPVFGQLNWLEQVNSPRAITMGGAKTTLVDGYSGFYSPGSFGLSDRAAFISDINVL